MEGNNKKKTIGLIIAVIVIIAVFAAITVLVTVTTEPAGTGAAAIETTAAGSEAAGESAGDVADTAEAGDENAASGDRAAAEELIDQTLSREEIEAAVGTWNKFNMDGNGCERGVYAGRFYYTDFVIYSRTYDKGKTFHIMSIN